MIEAHEPHGHCATCGYPVHRYPFGWQHVGVGMFSCSALAAVPTCCDSHGDGTTDGTTVDTVEPDGA